MSLSPQWSRASRVARRSIELVAALGAVVSGGLHLVMLLFHAHDTFIVSLLIAGMALVCLRCAIDLARHPRLATWFTTALMNAFMLLAHQPSAPTSNHGHQHADPAHTPSTHSQPGGFDMTDALTACASLELLIAVLVIMSILGIRGFSAIRRQRGLPDPVDSSRGGQLTG